MRDHSQIDLKLIWKRKVSVANHVSSIRLSADWQILWSLSVEIFARSNNRRRYNSNVVSWAKGPRYRSNRIQSGESRCAVEYINVSSVFSSGQFYGKSLRDPGHGVSGHVFDGTRKDKETLRVELVETPARTNARGVQYELRSESVRVQMPKTRVVELLAL